MNKYGDNRKPIWNTEFGVDADFGLQLGVFQNLIL